MNDFDICKRIAEIEHGKDWLESMLADKDLQHYNWSYNQLTDKALCFDLMVKHKVLITWNPHLNDNCTAAIDAVDEDLPYSFAIASANDKNPQRAICLAIIEAKAND